MEQICIHELKSEKNKNYSLIVEEKKADLVINNSNLVVLLNPKEMDLLTIKVIKGVQAECILRLENLSKNININILIEQDANFKQHLVRLNSIDDINLNLNVDVKINAQFNCIISEFSSSNCSYNVDVQLNEIAASSYLRLASVGANEENKQFKVLIASNAQFTSGKMDNYGVVKDKGVMVIEGIGKIKKAANGSKSDQTNKIIIFDQTANAIAKPLLYIDEYDVKASHACGVGKIDDNQIYYLCSRGLNETQAKRFITLGYLTPVINYLENNSLKEEIFDILMKKVE